MGITNYLPLGSIVMMENGVHRVMIVGRGLYVKQGDETYYFDYAGVLYPEGLSSEAVCYFNNDWISEVSFLGYNDEVNREIDIRIRNYVAQHPDLKRHPKPVNSTPEGDGEKE